mmetsp:Transcript_55797/g.158899  ORF Transcript_55797/g.158899 Transcript_55797/m.158899 type:complete len:102 (+) Transcript_55797:1158-1463(+)
MCEVCLSSWLFRSCSGRVCDRRGGSLLLDTLRTPTSSEEQDFRLGETSGETSGELCLPPGRTAAKIALIGRRRPGAVPAFGQLGASLPSGPKPHRRPTLRP